MPSDEASLSRRQAMLRSGAALAGAALAGSALADEANPAPQASAGAPAITSGRANQSVCQWCYKMPVEELADNARRMGLKGIDLLGPEQFPIVQQRGLLCTMTTSHGITKGLNRRENWDECLGKIRASIDATSAAGFPNVICFSGNRDGMDDEEGLKNCAEAIKQVVDEAERKKVTLCMELLNSKRNHKDYMCDRTAWGVRLCKAVGSDRFKLLYDIFHMQIDEGDVIATIRENKDFIAHYHTGGVPGRHEIDDSQELNYPAIVRAILDTGFKGIIAHEFIPTRDPMTSLAEAVKRCDV